MAAPQGGGVKRGQAFGMQLQMMGALHSLVINAPEVDSEKTRRVEFAKMHQVEVTGDRQG